MDSYIISYTKNKYKLDQKPKRNLEENIEECFKHWFSNDFLDMKPKTQATKVKID